MKELDQLRCQITELKQQLTIRDDENDRISKKLSDLEIDNLHLRKKLSFTKGQVQAYVTLLSILSRKG